MCERRRDHREQTISRWEIGLISLPTLTNWWWHPGLQYWAKWQMARKALISISYAFPGHRRQIPSNSHTHASLNLIQQFLVERKKEKLRLMDKRLLQNWAAVDIRAFNSRSNGQFLSFTSLIPYREEVLCTVGIRGNGLIWQVNLQSIKISIIIVI